MQEITSLARMEHLERLIQFVASHAEAARFPIQRIREIELAVEEVLVNIFSYAYPQTTGNVSIVCRVEDDRLILAFSDTGVPFNILEVPNPDLTADIAHRQVGGLGTFFVREMVNEAQYRREGAHNILTLIFNRDRRGSVEQEHVGGVQK